MTYPLISNYIGNAHSIGNSPRRGEVFNPALGEKTKEVYFSNKEDIHSAVSVALEAFQTWSLTPPLKRARIFFNFYHLLHEHLDELALLLTEEHGKVLNDAKAELLRGIDIVEYACGIPNLLRGHYAKDITAEMDSYNIPEPLGVCLGITPFNFPAMLPLWMFLSMACGNTFLLKPSERCPSVSLRLGELLQEAGLPSGVFNVIQGDKDTVDALLEHPHIRAISFVGSTPVARHIYKEAAAQGKRVQALGGAKNHCVVMPDANIHLVADGLVGAAFGSSGQRCMAISVAVVVGEKTADLLIEELKHRITELKIGSGIDPSIDMGPLITGSHLERVKQRVTQGVEQGAQLVVDGRCFHAKQYPQGFFMGACLFDHVTCDMDIYKDEIFGPVLCVLRVKTLEEAIEIINNNPYGNGTAIYTQQGDLARKFAANIQVGMVGINIPIPVPAAFFSFGGWKQSLFGDTHMYGTESIRFYTRLKNITTRWPTQHVKGFELHMPTMK